MKHFLSLCLLAASFSFSAQAAQFVAASDATPLVDEALARPPQPVKASPSLSALAEIWKNGPVATEATLRGSWRMVGRKGAGSCARDLGDEWNWRGIKVEGKPSVLVFDDQESPLDHKVYFSVTARGFGDKPQGPYKVEATEPQFSTFGYRENSEASPGWWESSCRHDANKATRLICAMHLDSESHKGWDETAIACAKRAIAGYVMYTKIR